MSAGVTRDERGQAPPGDEPSARVSSPERAARGGAPRSRRHANIAAFGMDVPEPPEPSAALPVRIGRFAVSGRLGAGGMGVVYVAHDEMLDRKVAVKLLHATSRDRSDAHARFVQREAQAMARLSHPNVVQVYEVGEHEGGLFVAMELVEGVDLRRWLRDDERPLAARLGVLLDAGRGLAAAHAAGVVHRDFKPENVIVGEDGRARVVDFGLAGPASVAADDVAGSDGGARSPSDSGGETRTARSDTRGFDSPLTPGGQVLGTPAYMAPEQFLGKAIDARADQFAFCVTAWEALFGKRPFGGPTRAAIFHAVLEGAVVTPPADVPVPLRIREALRRGLSAEPDARFPDMRALLGVLAHDEARVRRRRVLAASAVVAVIGAAWVGHTLGRSSSAQCTDFARMLAGDWDDDARATLRAHFAATGSPLGESAATDAIAALDRHAASWADTREAACAATHLRGEQSEATLDRTYACLDRDRQRMRALVGVLRGADASIVAHATDAVAALDDPAECARMNRTAAAPTGDPRRVAAITALRERLATAMALLATGELRRAHGEIVAVVDDARTLDDAALLAESLWTLGRVQRGLGMLTAARATLDDAHDVADAASDDGTRLGALLSSADLFGDGTRAIEDEARAIEQARAVATRVGATEREQAVLDALTVDHAVRAGRLDEARQAMASLQQRDVGDGFDLVARQALLARADGTPERATALYDAALVQARASYGELHPRTAAAIYNAGVARVDVGDFAGAKALIREALALWQRIYGALPSEDLGRAHVALLGCALGLGDLAAAREHATAATKAIEAAVGPDHPGRAEALLGLGVVEFTEGRFADAETSNREAVRILSAAWGDAHPQTAIARSNLGETLLALGRFSDARVELGAALTTLSATAGPDSPDLAFPLKGLGIAHLAEGNPTDAIEPLERAAAHNGAGEPLERLDIGAALAVAILLGPGDLARAKRVAASAAIDPSNAAAVERRRSLVAWLPKQRDAFERLGLLPPD